MKETLKNNQGVTLVELLIVIVILGIIAAIAVPAVGNIVENAERDAVIGDATAIRDGAQLYCASNAQPDECSDQDSDQDSEDNTTASALGNSTGSGITLGAIFTNGEDLDADDTVIDDVEGIDDYVEGISEDDAKYFAVRIGGSWYVAYYDGNEYGYLGDPSSDTDRDDDVGSFDDAEAFWGAVRDGDFPTSND